nr:olfactory receptor 5D13-like [Loxodonta africana]
MSRKLCAFLVAGSYTRGGICSLSLTYSLVELSFCGSNILNHFCSEYYAILSVFFSDPYFSQMACLIVCTCNETSSLLIILTSYIFIAVTAIKMSSCGLHKAFFTCASHLTAIIIIHGTILLLYCVPNSKSSWLPVKVATVFFIVMVPMLNLLIYRLRNKGVKNTVRQLVVTKLLSH